VSSLHTMVPMTVSVSVSTAWRGEQEEGAVTAHNHITKQSVVVSTQDTPHIQPTGCGVVGERAWVQHTSNTKGVHTKKHSCGHWVRKYR